MFRFIVRSVVFIGFFGLFVYLILQWKLSSDLEYFSEQLEPRIEFKYQNATFFLTGKISIQNIGLYFRDEDINLSIQSLEFSNGNLFDTILFRNRVHENDFPRNIDIQIEEAIIPLTPPLVKLIASTQQETVWDKFNALGCGSIKTFGINEYFSMGYDNIVFSTDINLFQDKQSGNLIGAGFIDIEQTSRIEFGLNLANVFPQQTADARAIRLPVLESLELEFKDIGYNNHKNEFCGLRANSSQEAYVENHVRQVKKALKSVGVKMKLSAQRALKNLMQPLSQLSVKLKPEVSFSLNNLGFYNETELRKELGLEVAINGKPVARLFESWSFDSLSNISFEESFEDKQNITDSNQAKRYETVIVRREYKIAAIGNADQYIGFQVKIVKDDSKVYEGKLVKIEKNRLYVDRALEGGIVQVATEVKLIKSFYIYR